MLKASCAGSLTGIVSGKPMLRIYCDFNNAIDERRYSLNCVGSLKDIERVGNHLKDGMKVVLYQTGELEAEATIHNDLEWGWVGIPDWKTKKYLDGISNR